MDHTTRLGLAKPGTRGTHPSSNELRDALRANADVLDDVLLSGQLLVGDTLQEGVLAAGDGVVTRQSGTVARVAAGAAWIDGDGVTGLNGRYRVTWTQTDLTVAAPLLAGENIGYRVVVPVPSIGHGASVPVLVAGTTQPGTVDHDALQGVPALPSGNLQLATLISGFTTGIVAGTGIRDRRPRALGLRYYTTLGAPQPGPTGTGYTTRSTLATGSLDFRMESLGVAPVEVGLDTYAVSPDGLLWLVLECLNNGTITKVREFQPKPGDNTFHTTFTPPAGSNLFQWKQYGTSSNGINPYSTGTNGGGRAIMTAKEILGSIGNNGVT